MIRFRTILPLVAVAALLSSASTASADFIVKFEFGGAKIELNRTTSTTTFSGGATQGSAIIDYSVTGEISVLNLVVSPTGGTGGFKLNATIASSNSPGTLQAATIDLSSLKIKNQTGIAGNSTLTISETDTGFTAPTGNPSTLISTMSATASGANTANASVTFNSYLDTTNTEFGTQQFTPTINLTIAPGTSQSDNKSADVNATPTPYSLTEILKITLANNDMLTDGSSGTSLIAPAPAGLLLVFTGMPVLGFGAWLRRRITKTV